jgi:ribosomal protein S18
MIVTHSTNMLKEKKKIKSNIYFYYKKFAKKYIKSFKDTKFLKYFANEYAQIKPGLETNIRKKFQTKISKAIKHARVANIFPYFY